MNTSEIRSGFTDYMKKRYPNDSNISATVSMAFFMERNSEMLGMDFQEVLSSRVVPATYKQKLEVSFEGSKNPRARASIYERSLRLLLEYLDGKPPIPINTPRSGNKPRSVSQPAQKNNIPRPTKETVIEYLERWKRLSGYTEQEEALYLLFRETYPTNTKLPEVLIKCSALNDFYGTNIFNIYPIAKHIVGLNIDARLANGDTNTPTYFWQMVQAIGGYQAAKKLIYTKNPSSGLTQLWDLRRLDLSVEAHVVKPEYNSLFTEEERRICAERLKSFEYELMGG